MTIFSGWPSSSGGRLPLELELPVAPAAPSAEPTDLEAPYVDLGMRIPESYGRDVIRALVQDPFHLMVYWELRPSSLGALGGLFPNAPADAFHPSMRLTDLEAGFEAYVAIPLTGKYWFGTMPGRTYRVDVGGRSAEHGFVPVVRSNTVETPRGTVAAKVDDDPRYQVETPRFVRLLAATGFATDRVLSEVARADAARAGGEAPDAGPHVPAYLVDAFGHLPDPVREAASAVAHGGSITDEMLARLPEWLRAVLLGLRRDGEEEILTAAFMHLLPQLLRQALEGGFVADAAHPLHLPPRFAIGSSEFIHKPSVDWSWMPSMTKTVPVKIELEPDPLDPAASAERGR
jgi:hypothetical protein